MGRESEEGCEVGWEAEGQGIRPEPGAKWRLGLVLVQNGSVSGGVGGCVCGIYSVQDFEAVL